MSEPERSVCRLRRANVGLLTVIGDEKDDLGPYASPPCFLHELDQTYSDCPNPPAPKTAEPRPTGRLLPERPFPSYAYLPGRFPHPIRDPAGHSYEPASASPTIAPPDPDAFSWGIDLFNHGYYWEAHEAWEALWQSAERRTAERDILHGLILLAAMGVKLREGKLDAARRHGTRAASYLRQAAGVSGSGFEIQLGLTATGLASRVEIEVDQFLAGANPSTILDLNLGRPR